MQTIVYQFGTAMPAQKLPNCCYKQPRDCIGYKVTFCLVYLGRFSPYSSVMYIKYTPSSHVENRIKLYDPVGNIYY